MSTVPFNAPEPSPDFDAELLAMQEASFIDQFADPNLELLEIEGFNAVMAAAKAKGLVPHEFSSKTLGSLDDLINEMPNAQSVEAGRFFAIVGRLTTNYVSTLLPNYGDMTPEIAVESLEDVTSYTDTGSPQQDGWVEVVAELFPDAPLLKDPAEHQSQLDMLGDIADIQTSNDNDLYEEKRAAKGMVQSALNSRYGMHDASKDVVNYIVNSAATLAGRTGLASEDLRLSYAAELRRKIIESGHPITEADVDKLVTSLVADFSSDKV